jgi:hypothetical protein
MEIILVDKNNKKYIFKKIKYDCYVLDCWFFDRKEIIELIKKSESAFIKLKNLKNIKNFNAVSLRHFNIYKSQLKKI